MATLDMGATADELASRPGLLTDLALCLVPKRAAVSAALLGLLGGNSAEKVRGLTDTLRDALRRMKDPPRNTEDIFVAARDVIEASYKLENAVFTLCIARAKRGLRAVPAPETQAEIGGVS